MKNYYEILGVSEKATPDEIKKAYRKLAREHHPDVSKTDSNEKFKEINEAYEILKDEEKKSRYDFQRNMGSQHSPFSSVFGGGVHFGFGGFPNQQQQPIENITIKIEVPLDLEELFSGVKKKAKYQRNTVCSDCNGKKTSTPEEKTACNHCGGTGRLNQRRGMMNIITSCPFCNGTGQKYKNPCKNCGSSGFKKTPHEVTLDIPPGGFTDNKQRFLKNNGHESLITPGKFGQLVVDISLKPHNLFKLQRNGDIILSMPLPMWVAICGGTIEVPTLHGPRNVEVKSGTQDGEYRSISGAGFWKPNRSGYADHIVVFKIEVPKNLTEEDKVKIKNISKGAKNYPDYFAILGKA